MRRRRTELEELVSSTVIQANKDLSPKLRDAIRDLLDKGATPAHVRRTLGNDSPLYRRAPMTALSVEFLVDEWERERGVVKPDESIEHV